MFKIIIFGFTLLMFIGFGAPAQSYDYSCPGNARKLKNAADEYESALSRYESAESDYESAKSSYESACSPGWGYARSDEGACGQYGYERSPVESAIAELEDAKSSLEYAASDLEGAVSRTSRSCGGASNDGNTLVNACIKELRKAKASLDRCESAQSPLKDATKATAPPHSEPTPE